jgi:hypothetical protein
MLPYLTIWSDLCGTLTRFLLSLPPPQSQSQDSAISAECGERADEEGGPETDAAGGPVTDAAGGPGYITWPLGLNPLADREDFTLDLYLFTDCNTVTVTMGK